jgi:hypothetical protein
MEVKPRKIEWRTAVADLSGTLGFIATSEQLNEESTFYLNLSTKTS